MPSPTGEIAGLILAGGASRRMGRGHKFLLELGGETMLDRTVARLSPQVARLAISANCDPALLGGTRLPVLADPPPAPRGPLSGLAAGLEWAAAQNFSRVVTAASDTPFFPEDLVSRLCAAASSADAVVLAASNGRVHPVFGLWPVCVAPMLGRFLREDAGSRMMDFVERCEWTSVDFPCPKGLDPFFNVNTSAEFAEAERRIGGKM